MWSLGQPIVVVIVFVIVYILSYNCSTYTPLRNPTFFYKFDVA